MVRGAVLTGEGDTGAGWDPVGCEIIDLRKLGFNLEAAFWRSVEIQSKSKEVIVSKKTKTKNYMEELKRGK